MKKIESVSGTRLKIQDLIQKGQKYQSLVPQYVFVSATDELANMQACIDKATLKISSGQGDKESTNTYNKNNNKNTDNNNNNNNSNKIIIYPTRRDNEVKPTKNNKNNIIRIIKRIMIIIIIISGNGKSFPDVTF